VGRAQAGAGQICSGGQIRVWYGCWYGCWRAERVLVVVRGCWRAERWLRVGLVRSDRVSRASKRRPHDCGWMRAMRALLPGQAPERIELGLRSHAAVADGGVWRFVHFGWGFGGGFGGGSTGCERAPTLPGSEGRCAAGEGVGWV
jgi:hypothetical protein